jgi:tetratricopeptide (TPR) repeat protein
MLPLLSLVVLLAAPVGPYNEGNKLYAQKDYAGAAQAYEQALKTGPSPVVHFNLGNALFKSGHIGQAILHYRRAHYLDPRDPDITSNLTFARAYRVDKVATQEGPVAKELDELFHGISRGEAVVLAAIFCTLACALLSAWIVWRWPWLIMGASVFGIVTLYGLIAQGVWAGEVRGRPAVVVVPEVNALSGPGEEFKQILLLHDGTEVNIHETRGDYLLVQLPGGGGWIPKQSVERVY